MIGHHGEAAELVAWGRPERGRDRSTVEVVAWRLRTGHRNDNFGGRTLPSCSLGSRSDNFGARELPSRRCSLNQVLIGRSGRIDSNGPLTCCRGARRVFGSGFRGATGPVQLRFGLGTDLLGPGPPRKGRPLRSVRTALPARDQTPRRVRRTSSPSVQLDVGTWPGSGKMRSLIASRIHAGCGKNRSSSSGAGVMWLRAPTTTTGASRESKARSARSVATV